MSRSKVMSGAMMVAGTSIGAAMIVMPISAAKIGFYSSVVLMIIVALTMYHVSQVVLDIYRITNSDATVSKIAGQILGKPFQLLCTIATLVLMYSLLVAYISGLSEIVSQMTGYGYVQVVLRVVIFLSVSLALSYRIFDYYNRIAFSLKILFMCLMTAALLPYVAMENLIATSIVNEQGLNILKILPVFITSFGFHAGIPFIFKFLNRDEKLYNQATLYGVCITLIIYLVWLALAFGVVPSTELMKSSNELSDFTARLRSNIESPLLSISINFFVMLGILTSLFGVATTVFDFVEESLRDRFEISSRILCSILTFGLPTIFVLANKNLFLKALSLAGCALTIIAIIIPILIRLKLGGSFNKSTIAISFMVGLLTVIGELISIAFF
jgi:tyrosine-specific transport protein